MSIAVLHSGDMNKVSVGGVDRYIKSLILFSDDYEITVFGTTKSGEHIIGKEYKKEYCNKHYYFIPITDDSRRPLSFYYMLREFLWIKKLGEYDCIYAQRTEYSIPFVISGSRRKLIEMIHGSSRYSEIGFGKKMAKVHLALERIAISVAAKTLVILNREEFGVPYYKAKYKKYSDRFIYGKNPIDTSIYCRKGIALNKCDLGIPSERRIVLYSGRIEDNPKRVMLLPLICKCLVDDGVDVEFIVLGDGSDKFALEHAVEKIGIKDRFYFGGYIESPYTISEYNNIADVSINISIFEGTCTSILESIACGTPVVATDVGDINECVSKGVNGVIIENNDSTIIENAVSAIKEILAGRVLMNDVYLKYAGENVIRELRQVIMSL